MITPDMIIRSKRKTLSIAVDAFGRLIVRAPHRCSEERIFAFLHEKEEWIVRKQRQRAEVGIQLPPENLQGYKFPLLGKELRIELTDKRKIGLDGDVIYLPRKNSRERLVGWLKANARRILTEVTERKAEVMGVSFHSVAVSSARTRWGTCSYDNKIRYSFRLLFAPQEVVEYVVVHELTHVKLKNHSPAFWREVERYIPDYKVKCKWLEMHSGLMEIF